MTKQTTQIDLILEIIGRFPGGASVEEILLGLKPSPSSSDIAVSVGLFSKKWEPCC